MHKRTEEQILEEAKLTREEFLELYLEKEFSLVDFKTIYGIPYKQTQRILDNAGVPKRNVSQSRKTKRIKEKIKAGLTEKYGEEIENISQVESIKIKKADTFTKNYGVDNIFKSKDYYVYLHNLMLERYGAKSVPNLHGNANPFGVKTLSKEKLQLRIQKMLEGGKIYWSNLTDEQKNEIIISRCKGLVNYCDSSLERKVKQGLENLKIKFKPQFWIKQKGFDFFLKDHNIIIEVQGDFWHANPLIYQETDIVNHPGGKVLAREIWLKDKLKKELAEMLNYRVIYIWESELKNLDQPAVMNLILNKIYEIRE